MRTGDVLGLATTNALELGVDISGLDAVLIAGWPGTRMSVWQQAGRAGRAGADGLVAFVAREDPLDTFLVHHPEAVFDAPLEATVFDPANPYVLAPHLCAAAAENPLRSEDLPAFGDPEAVRGLLDVLVARGALRRRASGWYWTHAQPASGMTDLRGSGGAPVRVAEARTGRLLGTVDAASADGSVHDGAVYVHQGRTYVVEHLDLADHVALVRRQDVDHGTWSRSTTSIAIVDDPADGDVAAGREVVERSWGPVGWGYGPVDVCSRVVSFQRRRLPDLQVLGTETLDLPERTLPTMAVWWTVPQSVIEVAEIDADEPARRAARRRARVDRPAAAPRDVRPLGPRRRLDRPARRHRRGDRVRARRLPRRGRLRRARVRARRDVAPRDTRRDRALPLSRRLSRVRAVPQVRVVQRPAREGRRRPTPRCGPRPRPGGSVSRPHERQPRLHERES